MDPIAITSLQGGLNTSDSPFSLSRDQVVVCENVDLSRSTLGGRRLGSAAITTSGLNTAVVFLHRHLPTSDMTAAQLWAVSVSGTTSKFVYKDTTWHDVTPTGTLALDVARGKYAIQAQTLHGKLFLAYPSASGTDRLRVWDGNAIRVTGLAAPAAPSVAGTGTGSYSTVRYFRVRYTKQSGGVTILRSEPSAVTTFTPGGSDLSARVTKPAAISEGETHWEVEESINNADFYRIATVVVGTTTYDDSLAATQVAVQGTLAADVGDYTLQHSPKFLSADQDRLLMAGAWEQAALRSRVAWTPVFGAPGAGNDERFEADTDPYLDLDNYDGGEITDFAGPINGYHVAFKYERIYKIIRTNARSQGYQAIGLSDTTGAITRSVVKGLDEQGRASLYFIDPAKGPSRLGSNGIEHLGEDIRKTFDTWNKNADLFSHGVFHRDKSQVWWWVAEAGQSTPTKRIVANIQSFVAGPNGTRRGWSFDTGNAGAALCSAVYSDNIEAGVARSRTLKPLIGTGSASRLIAICDSGTQDFGTNYQAKIRTRPFLPTSTLGKAGVAMGTLMAVAASGVSVRISLIRDYGVETISKDVVLTPSASETSVIKPVDDLSMSEVTALQVELGDAAAQNADWELESLVLKMTPQERY